VFGQDIPTDKPIYQFFQKYEAAIFCGRVPEGCQEG
jgi:hypothetical protein